jgi:murein DD-endopeptidase MepM/ murein hydrolase activator NlpD
MLMGTALAVLNLGVGTAAAQSGGIAPGGVPIDAVDLAGGSGQVTPKRFFFGSQQKAVFRYATSADLPVNVRVDVLQTSSGAVVKSFAQGRVPAGQVRTVRWNGLTSSGAVAPPGAYRFRVVSELLSRSARASQTAGDGPAFDFYQFMFPVQGAHNFGGRGARFGAGRRGHRHEGQDAFAKCGTPIVAARAGRVQFRGRHGAAGNYVVIDGRATGKDYMYAHLKGQAQVRRGQRVFTGQQIGLVGQSGNARGCHLHFEIWSPPGWYDGGRPYDPLPSLTAWDVYS